MDVVAHGNSPVRSVLFVDDEEILRRSFARYSRPGLQVIVAGTCKEALKLAAQHGPDLVIVDLQLGRESGLDLLREIKAAHCHLPVVLISGHASVDIAVQAMRAGAVDVIEKPVGLGEVLHRLNNREGDPQEIPHATAEQAQSHHMHRVLADCKGNVTLAAKKLGLHRTTLRRRLQRRRRKTARLDH